MGKIIALIEAYLRIFLKKKWLILFTIAFPVLFFIFFSMVFTNYEDVNKIPIGLVDEDQTLLSHHVGRQLLENPAIKIVSSDYDESLKLLKNNRIEAIFILKQGYADHIQTSAIDNAIDLIYLDKSSIGPTLGDIIASAAISDIAIFKAATTGERYGQKFGYENLYDTIIINGYNFIAANQFEMTIHSTVRTPQALLDEDINIQRILKLNITFGFTLVVLSFVILFSNSHFIDDRQSGVFNKLIASGYHSHHLFISQFLSILISAVTVVIIQMILYSFGLGLLSLRAVLIMGVVFILHIVFLTNLITILTVFIKDKTKYQSLIAPLIFFLGLIGGAFWSIEFLSGSFQWLSYFSPFYWSLRMLNGVMLNNSDLPYLAIILGYSLFNGLCSALAVLLNHAMIRKLQNN